MFESQTNPAISFSIYTPKNFSESHSLPVIYFFDPHADGKLPLEKYRSLADEMNLFLVGCNSSQNGMSMEESGVAASAMITDCSKRMLINTAITNSCRFFGRQQGSLCNSYAASFSIRFNCVLRFCF
ncbi:MAG: hypothetical protein R2847_00835 [Bacteroidia bacterium]